MPFGAEELPALERGDHLVDVVALALLSAWTIICAGDEAVRREEVRHLAALPHLRRRAKSLTLFFGAV